MLMAHATKLVPGCARGMNRKRPLTLAMIATTSQEPGHPGRCADCGDGPRAIGRPFQAATKSTRWPPDSQSPVDFSQRRAERIVEKCAEDKIRAPEVRHFSAFFDRFRGVGVLRRGNLVMPPEPDIMTLPSFSGPLIRALMQPALSGRQAKPARIASG